MIFIRVEIVKRIDLYTDLTQELRLKQGDDTLIKLYIYARGKPFDLTGCTFTFNSTVEDTLVALETGFTSDGNLLQFDLPSTVCATSGRRKFELIIYNDGKRVSTYIFSGSVAPTLASEQTVATDAQDGIISALTLSSRAPYIGDNGNWFIFDNTSGAFIDSGNPARGSGADLSYIHTQGIASDTWSVNHNLGKYPSVSIVDSSGNSVIGEIQYTSVNALTIKFIGAFTGYAYCN